MLYKKFWILLLCLGFLFPLMSHAQSNVMSTSAIFAASARNTTNTFSLSSAELPLALAWVTFCPAKRRH